MQHAGNRLWEWWSVGRYGTAGYDVKQQNFIGEEWPEVRCPLFKCWYMQFYRHSFSLSMRLPEPHCEPLPTFLLSTLEVTHFPLATCRSWVTSGAALPWTARRKCTACPSLISKNKFSTFPGPGALNCVSHAAGDGQGIGAALPS